MILMHALVQDHRMYKLELWNNNNKKEKKKKNSKRQKEEALEKLIIDFLFMHTVSLCFLCAKWKIVNSAFIYSINVLAHTLEHSLCIRICKAIERVPNRARG